jgi:hypothetical protein
MTENTTAAQAVLDAAIKAGRVEGACQMPAELAPARRKIILAVETHTRRAHESVGSLPYGRIHCVFLYTVCRGYEAAYYWRAGGDYEVSTAGMFTGEVQCNVSDEMIERLRDIPLADELFEGFTKWAAAHAGTLGKDADPFSPLMDALDMAYRVAYAVGLRILQTAG